MLLFLYALVKFNNHSEATRTSTGNYCVGVHYVYFVRASLGNSIKCSVIKKAGTVEPQGYSKNAWCSTCYTREQQKILQTPEFVST